jgi:hypothetical protein
MEQHGGQLDSRWILDKKLAGLPPKKKLSKLQMDSRDPQGLHRESVAECKVLSEGVVGFQPTIFLRSILVLFSPSNI